MPFVSVIIPTHNMRELLREAIESLYSQSYPKDRYEIIVVDNTSTDGTEEMMSCLKEESPCLLKYYRKDNEGPGSSRNLGIREARGTIVAFTDSDCIVDRDWLRNGTAGMSEGVGLVQGKTIPNPEQIPGTFCRTQKITRENGMYATCNIFYRKEALDQVGGFSTEFCGLNRFGKPRWGGEDTDLAWRVKKRGWGSVFSGETLAYHHIFPLRPWQAITSLRKYQFQGLFYAIPYLVKKHPELRRYLYYGLFLNRTKAFFSAFVLSLLAGTVIHKGFLLFTLPYLLLQIRNSFAWRPIRKYHRGLVVFMTRVLSDLVDFILLLGGSLWHRTIVL